MSSKVTAVELSEHARGLGKIAFDSTGGTVSTAAYDNIHSECVSVLTALAKAGHTKSQALLNPPKAAVAQDAKRVSREASVMVGSIGF